MKTESETTTMKQTLGRRKVPMKKIENKSQLQVTFTKRRRGLFHKASELSLLCGAEVGIIVESPGGKLFTFEAPSLETLIHRVSPPSDHHRINPQSHVNNDGGSNRRKYEETVKALEAEEKRALTIQLEKETRGSGFWWNDPFHDLEIHQLQEFGAALEFLRDHVTKKINNSTIN